MAMSVATATKGKAGKAGKEKRAKESPIKVTLPQCEVSRMCESESKSDSECESECIKKENCVL